MSRSIRIESLSVEQWKAYKALCKAHKSKRHADQALLTGGLPKPKKAKKKAKKAPPAPPPPPEVNTLGSPDEVQG